MMVLVSYWLIVVARVSLVQLVLMEFRIRERKEKIVGVHAPMRVRLKKHLAG